jgi:hypothetical protein
MVTFPMAHRVERGVLARMFIEMTRQLRVACVADAGRHDYHVDGEMMLIGLAVMVGHAENRPMNGTSIAEYLELPRATVQRKLQELINLKVIERRGRVYLLAPHRAANFGKRIEGFVRIQQKASKELNRP